MGIGTVGCLLSYFFIPLLHLAARAMVPEDCGYQGWRSPSVSAYLVAVQSDGGAECSPLCPADLQSPSAYELVLTVYAIRAACRYLQRENRLDFEDS